MMKNLYDIRNFNKQFLTYPRNWEPGSEQISLLKWNLWSDLYKDKLDLEIGCGAGKHPLQYSNIHPDRLLIAIERTAEKFSSFNKQLNTPRNNLMAIHADAIPWVSLLAPDNVFERIFILYPNPNPKNSSQRFIRMPFFSELLRVLKPQGTITMSTNIRDYYLEFLDFGQKAWNLKELQNISFSKKNYSDFFPEFKDLTRTHFEKKYLDTGQTCFQLQFQK